MLRKPVTSWPGIGDRRSFGDFLAELLADELFHPVTVRARAVFLVGSCIDDLIFPDPADAEPTGPDERLVFWGCGMRTPAGLSERNRARSEIFAVRGPLTRDALRLGDTIPVGDSTLFLPVLHEARPHPGTAGRSVCIPHVLDTRSDAELLQLADCDLVLRPSLPHARQSLLDLIDAIASADFVLSASLHGAIVAAAYGRPFAYWDNGHVDLPFEWADFSASVEIETRFAANLREARSLHADVIARSLRLPPLWPLLAVAPLAIRPDAALKVLAYDSRGRSMEPDRLRAALASMASAQRAIGEVSGYRAAGVESLAWPASAIISALGESERLIAGNAELRGELQELQERSAESLRLRREIMAEVLTSRRITIALEREVALLREELAIGWADRVGRGVRGWVKAIAEYFRKRNRERLLARRRARGTAPRNPPRLAAGGIIDYVRAKNRERLARRHRPDGPGGKAAPPAPPPPLSPKVANRAGRRVLFVDSVYPKPDRDSGSVTARYLIEIFLELGWQVTFYSDAERHPEQRYVEALESLGVRCVPAPDTEALERFLRAEGSTFSLCILFRVYSGGRHLELVRRYSPDAKIVFETVDLHFLREERQARLYGDRRALNLALALRERELYVARCADLTIVVSDYEHQLLVKEVPGVRAMTLPLILDCRGRTAPFSGRSGVCFIGGYLHPPNVDAVTHFLDEIWPLVVEQLPSCVFHIVGSDMPDVFRSRASANVVPVGHVPDLEGFLARMRVTVAPLRYGAGVKGKIGSSLANGVPCVASPTAAEGMGLATGHAIAVADDPAEFAKRIVALHEDEAEWIRMSDAGWRHASEQFSVDAARERIAAMLRELTLTASPDAGAEDSGPHPTAVSVRAEAR